MRKLHMKGATENTPESEEKQGIQGRANKPAGAGVLALGPACCLYQVDNTRL